MNPLTLEWVEKAEGDFGTAEREMGVAAHPNYDAVCFHAQQCAEKYLKALLQETNQRFGRTHNLVALLELVKRADPNWEVFHDSFMRLNEYSVTVRYPGWSADAEAAREALDTAAAVRARARAALTSPGGPPGLAQA